jgi:uncharacterized protein YcbX
MTSTSSLPDTGSSVTTGAILFAAIAGLFPFLALLALGISKTPKALPPPAGCRKIGIKKHSNLEDQYSKKYAKGGDPTPENPWTIKALFIYPLKSGAAIELEKSDVMRTGFKYDRQFTLAQQVTSLPSLDGKVTSEWKFMTQRNFPRLAKVETEMWVPDPSARDYKEDGEWVKSGGCLVMRFPFTPDTDFTIEGLANYGKIMAAKLSGRPEPTLEFRVPFDPPQERIKSKGYKNEVLRIWHDSPIALNMTSEIEHDVFERLRYTLGAANPIALFRIDTNAYRKVQGNAPKKEDVGFETVIGMQDSYPVHIMNLASVHDVASRLPSTTPKSEHIWQNRLTLLDAMRFRANIYITGPPAFAEDHWTKARITSSSDPSSSLNLHVSCRTTRCKLPNVDQKTAVPDRNEPSTTMRSYRIIDEGSKNACLGMQVTPLDEGCVAVGDKIEVLEVGEHRFLGLE